MKTGSSVVINMLVKVLRRLTLDEVVDRMEKIERAQGMSFDDFEEQTLTTEKIEDEPIETYYRWAALVHAYRGYMEDGNLHCVIEELHDLSSDQLKTLTPRRLELLCALSDLRVESINDLAHKVRRDVKNVHRDLQILRNLDLVRLNRKGNRKIVPEALVGEITFITQ